MKQIPIIVLVFFNDRLGNTKFLPALEEELRSLRHVFRQAEKEKLCETVILPNASVNDIVSALTHPLYQDRIAVFHFAGHANSFRLQLDGGKGQVQHADAKGLAEFLGHQNGLKLVFLNGCSTLQHADYLLKNGVENVLVTSGQIKDEAAKAFAIQFYQRFAEGASVEKAFHLASSAKNIVSGSNRNLAFTIDQQSQAGGSWQLLTKPGCEASLAWNLPEAVADPLYGLPEISGDILPASPYPNLHWYTRSHASLFFGRGHEIRELYDQISDTSSPSIILVFGRSGVGKSSILEAGILPRIKLARYQRLSRQLSIEQQVGDILKETEKEKKLESWQARAEAHEEPFTVIIDQVEGIFTPSRLVGKKKAEDFAAFLSEFNDAKIGSIRRKLILSLRKEYLADLEDLLRSIQLPYSKFFIKPLDQKGIVEIVKGVCQTSRLRNHYNISISSGLPELIANEVLGGGEEAAIAPTVQIILHQLWVEATQKHPTAPVFSQDLYDDVKKRGFGLEDFLEQKLGELPNDSSTSGLALDVLKFHIDAYGTARLRKRSEVESAYSHLLETVHTLISHFKEAYLLMETDLGTKLGHDVLGPLIIRRYNESDLPGQRAIRILEGRQIQGKTRVERSLLSSADLKIIKAGRGAIRKLDQQEEQLITDSQIYLRKRKLMISVILGLLAIALASTGIIARYLQVEKMAVQNLSTHYQSSKQAWEAMELMQVSGLQVLAFEKAKVAFHQDPSNLYTIGALNEIYRSGPLHLPKARRKLDGSLEHRLGNKGKLGASVASGLTEILRGDSTFWSQVYFPKWFMEGSQNNSNFLVDISTDDDYALVVNIEEKRGVIYRSQSKHHQAEFQLEEFPAASYFSQDQNAIVHVYQDGKSSILLLWDRPILSLETYNGLSVSERNGGWMVGSSSGTIELWSHEGKVVERSNAYLGDIQSISPLTQQDQFLVATDEEISICHFANGELDQFLLQAFENGPYSSARPVQGNRVDHLITVSEHLGNAYIYSLEDQRVLWELMTQGDELLDAFMFNSEPSTLLTYHHVGKLKLWNTLGGPPSVTDSIDFKFEVNSLEFSRDGKKILVASSNKAYLLPIKSTGTHFGNSEKELVHQDDINQAIFSPDGQLILTASMDHSVKLWTEKGDLLHSFIYRELITDIAFSQNGNQILLCDHRGRCQIELIDPQIIIASIEQALNTIKNRKK